MKRSNNIIVSLILVLLIVVFVSKALQNSYSEIKTQEATKERVSKKVFQQHTNDQQINNSAETDKGIEVSNSTSKNGDNIGKSKKIIVIDPGHGDKANLEKEPIAPDSKEMKIKDGGGAEGIVTKNPEYLVNMEVAVKLKKLLENRGYVVKMTKTNNSENPGNIERAEVGNKENAALVIRIHADSSENSNVKGASVLVPEAINENTRSIEQSSGKYGKLVLDTLVKEVGMQNMGVIKRNDITGFNWSKVPVILVEMGFLSNSEEDKLLNTENYKDKIAKALSDGIDLALR